MNLSIPIYIEELKSPDNPHSQFALRPLFFEAPVKQSQNLATGLSKLAQAIRQILDGHSTSPRMEALIPWTFTPALTETPVKFVMHLRRQTVNARFLVITFESLDRRIGFVPAVNDLYFEISRGQSIAERAREVLTAHFLQLEKEDAEQFTFPARLTAFKRAWVTPLEIDIHPNPKKTKPGLNLFMAIASSAKPDGRFELAKIGRCLDWLYPDELDRVILRDREVDELATLLAHKDQRPVLLLGQRRVGKTAVIHEAVFRRAKARNQPHVTKHNVWLISPQRLIAGMSHVGQWESRLLAILEESQNRDHVLYFDDVLGLYQAGQSADSDLNVAAVMRPWIERRQIRLLAEMTPQAFRIFQEKDRGLADQFHVLHIREPAPPQTRSILTHVIRELEFRHKCVFNLDVLPTTIDLQTRYIREQAMPGKAAGFLQALGIKFREREITRTIALKEFASRSGVSVDFLDEQSRLERTQITREISKLIIGQDHAVEALADVVSIAKARLNDPDRPMGTLLFLGPTGVGKTQCAKALATYLYGDETRLLRFDMNEYLDPMSLQRLIGNFAQPEGLLTSAVRRQPFCVLLLDEIEKAHPDVFDLFLQLLGEARLTDSLGRTTDFSNAIIVMTSNLGTREASHAFGLRPTAQNRDETFVDAAKAFFRPEFFNRIDRIVPFNPLSREHIAAIANQLIQGLFTREGLVHRRCVLNVEPAAMNRVIAQGYHPQLGARALKRSIETQLTQPIAARLAAMPPDVPTIISIYPSGDGILPHVQPLVNAASVKPPSQALQSEETDTVLERVESWLNTIEQTDSANESSNAVTIDALSPSHFRYFAVREQIRKIDQMIRHIDQATVPKPVNRQRVGAKAKAPRRTRRIPAASFDSDSSSTVDLHAHLSNYLATSTPIIDEPREMLTDLLQESAFLHLLASEQATAQDRALIILRQIGMHSNKAASPLVDVYLNLFSRQFGFISSPLSSRDDPAELLLLEMPAIATFLAGEEGTHLFYQAHQNIVPVQVIIKPLSHDQDAATAAKSALSEIHQWRRAVENGQRDPGSDPYPLKPITRIYDPSIATFDLKSRLLCPKLPSPDDLRRFTFASLPLPPELTH